MNDITIKGVVDPVASLMDSRKGLLDNILNTFKTNPGKCVDLAVNSESNEAKIKKARRLRTLISRLSKDEPIYSTISIIIDDRDGQLNFYAKQQEMRKGTKVKKSKQKEQPQTQTQQPPQQ